MKCPACGGAELLHDTRDIPYSYKGESTTIPHISGDYCPACGEAVLDLEDGDRYCALIAQFHGEVRERLGISGQPEPMPCPTCSRGELVHDTRDVPFTYLGETILIEAVTGDFCDACDEFITGAAETDRVMLAMATFKKQCDARRGSNDDK